MAVADELDEIELAVVAHRVDGAWQLDDLPDRALADAAALLRELGTYAASAVALVSVGEDFAVLARAGDPARLVLSDQTAALEWDLARSVAERLDVEVGEDDDPAAVGDLDLLTDLGLDADDLTALVDDEPHPDDLLVAVADELGFGDELEDALAEDDTDDEDDEEDVDDDEDDDDLDEDDAYDLLDDDSYDIEDDDNDEDDDEDEDDEEEEDPSAPDGDEEE